MRAVTLNAIRSISVDSPVNNMGSLCRISLRVLRCLETMLSQYGLVLSGSDVTVCHMDRHTIYCREVDSVSETSRRCKLLQCVLTPLLLLASLVCCVIRKWLQYQYVFVLEQDNATVDHVAIQNMQGSRSPSPDLGDRSAVIEESMHLDSYVASQESYVVSREEVVTRQPQERILCQKKKELLSLESSVVLAPTVEGAFEASSKSQTVPHYLVPDILSPATPEMEGRLQKLTAGLQLYLSGSISGYDLMQHYQCYYVSSNRDALARYCPSRVRYLDANYLVYCFDLDLVRSFEEDSDVVAEKRANAYKKAFDWVHKTSEIAAVCRAKSLDCLLVPTFEHFSFRYGLLVMKVSDNAVPFYACPLQDVSRGMLLEGASGQGVSYRQAMVESLMRLCQDYQVVPGSLMDTLPIYYCKNTRQEKILVEESGAAWPADHLQEVDICMNHLREIILSSLNG